MHVRDIIIIQQQCIREKMMYVEYTKDALIKHTYEYGVKTSNLNLYFVYHLIFCIDLYLNYAF